MKFEIASAAIVAGFLIFTPVMAAPLLGQRGQASHGHMRTEAFIVDVQYTRGGSRDFRRCMRAKYGPRYFNRVPRAHRFHMAQACGG